MFQPVVSVLILPGDPEFYETLISAPPPDYKHLRDRYNGDVALVNRGGVLQTVSSQEAFEYAWGGEMDLYDDNEDLEENEWLLEI